MQKEKVRWELHKNAACCLEQILEAAPHKTAAVQPLTTYFINYSSKMNKICGALLEKQEQTHKWNCLMDSYTWSANTSMSMWRSPQENITCEFISDFPVMPTMFSLSYSELKKKKKKKKKAFYSEFIFQSLSFFFPQLWLPYEVIFCKKI